MLQSSPIAISEPLELDRILLDAARTIFGVLEDWFTDEMADAVTVAIGDRYPAITLLDIQTAYRTEPVEWRKGEPMLLTRDKMLEPVGAYWKKKIRLQAAIDDELQEAQLTEAAQRKNDDFLNAAMDLYKESLDAGHWLGDCFQARTFYKNFRERFTEEQREQLRVEAHRQHAEAKEVAIMSGAGIPVPQEYTLAQLVVQESVRLGYYLIID